MARRFLLALLVVCVPGLACAHVDTHPAHPAVRYGANAAAGRSFVHGGVTLYYEVYGAGEPLLLVHGNGGSIADLGAQIDHFRKHYRVIAMDSRDQGRSGDSAGALTYEKMADDLAALLAHLDVGPADVLGWSDGGIEALLLAIRHPARVKKIVSMATNLNASGDAFPPEVAAWLAGYVESISTAGTAQAERERKVARIMLDQPDIDPEALRGITAPTLVMAGDRDLIRDEHTLDIYHHIPNSQLAILPNQTHLLPFDDPELFNATVERFLRSNGPDKDRIDDTIRSLEKLRAVSQ